VEVLSKVSMITLTTLLEWALTLFGSRLLLKILLEGIMGIGLRIGTINPYFGSAQELKDLVAACHARDIWVMVDVVANHVGPVGTDYS